MGIEKLVRVWKSQWEAMLDEQGVTSLFDVKNEF